MYVVRSKVLGTQTCTDYPVQRSYLSQETEAEADFGKIRCGAGSSAGASFLGQDNAYLAFQSTHDVQGKQSRKIKLVPDLPAAGNSFINGQSECRLEIS